MLIAHSVCPNSRRTFVYAKTSEFVATQDTVDQSDRVGLQRKAVPLLLIICMKPGAGVGDIATACPP